MTTVDPVAIPAAAHSPLPMSTADLNASPAAMFLSAFSPPVSLPLEESLVVEDREGDVIGGYTLGKIIGYGASSTIRRASNSTDDEGSVAVKIVRIGSRARQARKALQKGIKNFAFAFCVCGCVHAGSSCVPSGSSCVAFHQEGPFVFVHTSSVYRYLLD